MHKLLLLQALRAVAAALVVFSHALQTYSEKITPTQWVQLEWGAGFGVQVFFIISGFIIYRTTVNQPPGPCSVVRFLSRRVVRIAPVYWLATLIYALKLILQGNPPGWLAMGESLLFIPYRNPDEAGMMRPVLGVGWSLNYEMFFYLLLGLALMLPKAARFTAVSMMLLGFMLLGQSRTGGADSGYWLLATHWLGYFLLGMCIAMAESRLHAHLPALRGSVVLIAVGLLVGCFLLLSNRLTLTPAQGHLLSASLGTLAVLLCVTARSGRAQNRHVRFVQRWLVNAGDGSYSTYLFHSFALGPVARVLAKLHITPPPLLFAAAMVLLCSLLGYVIYRLFELRVTGVLNAQLARRLPQAAPLTAEPALSVTKPR
ncbi:acyltransferase [Granulosicoccaceae sp. 1_MG-2023]|nr:acyltransferase [Granulosicoccaceae sp. 1_MG-2023]